MKKNNSSKTKITVAIILVVLLAASAYAFLASRDGQNEYIFKTVTVERGGVTNTVTATGTLEATNTVVVGTQVSGVIEKLYVDFNSVVKKGQLIAELDQSTLQSSLENAQADLDNATAEVEYQKANFKRIKEVYDKGFSAQSEYDLAKYNYKKSEAGLKSANANLSRAARNLSYAKIYAPIDGIVLNRAVEEGQTVAASMNTPELFTITNDLSEMQVEADVDEADIGMVKKGQRVEFTVDAFSDVTFSGEITEVRLQPNESANVITYTVIVSAQNPDFKLKPGMTASITDYVVEVNDVLLLAGKAIRFNPDREVMMGYMKSLPESEQQHRERGAGPEGPPEQSGGHEKPELADNMKRVWVKDGNVIKPTMIETGVNDGIHLQVISGLKEGDVVVTAMEKGVTDAVQKEETSKSPFVQERPGRPGGQK